MDGWTKSRCLLSRGGRQRQEEAVTSDITSEREQGSGEKRSRPIDFQILTRLHDVRTYY